MDDVGFTTDTTIWATSLLSNHPMKYTTLGNTGLIVSKLSFGSLSFTNDESFKSVFRVDKTLAQQMVHHCLDNGVNFFDTADAYAGGKSEVMLGEVLGPRRKEVVLATKTGFRTGRSLFSAGLSRKYLLNACEASLKRLKTDYLDLYICHREDPHTPLEETLEALHDLVKQGKTRYVGFSNWSAWKVATALQMQKQHGWAQFCSGQLFYSLVERGVENELVPLMEYAQVALNPWSPLAGGFLSGKYTTENLANAENRLSGFDVLLFDKAKGFQLIEEMRTIAKNHDASVAQVAIAWLLSKKVVGSVIIGATNMAQLQDNLHSINLSLTHEALAQLDELTKPFFQYPKWFIENFADLEHQKIL
jgi:aryl-alcohol dehydrogenase-like predicted oxidoreductase